MRRGNVPRSPLFSPVGRPVHLNRPRVGLLTAEAHYSCCCCCSQASRKRDDFTGETLKEEVTKMVFPCWRLEMNCITERAVKVFVAVSSVMDAPLAKQARGGGWWRDAAAATRHARWNVFQI